MYIISDFNRDIQTRKPNPGSYEWWYFDAISENGDCIVIIFYEGNPFSRRYIQSLNDHGDLRAGQFPAISISLYQNGKPQFYSFEEVTAEQASFSDREPYGRIRENQFSGMMADGKIKYTLRIDQTLPNGDRLEGELLFSSDSAGIPENNINHGSADSGHSWNLVQPKCNVKGTLYLSGFIQSQIQFRGNGYHDHNTGHEPMKVSFDEWYWGRYHFDHSTLVYYIMNQKGVQNLRAWIIEDRGTVMDLHDGISLSDLSYSIFGLNSSRKIEFRGKGVEALLQLERVMDNGPFYQRFSGMVVMEKDGQIYKTEGISEYIKPNRIYNKIFWPLVDMRINYPGKAHWVQKSPKLYRWTW